MRTVDREKNTVVMSISVYEISETDTDGIPLADFLHRVQQSVDKLLSSGVYEESLVIDLSAVDYDGGVSLSVDGERPETEDETRQRMSRYHSDEEERSLEANEHLLFSIEYGIATLTVVARLTCTSCGHFEDRSLSDVDPTTREHYSCGLCGRTSLVVPHIRETGRSERDLTEYVRERMKQSDCC